MNRASYRPGPLATVHTTQQGGKSTLHFVRDFEQLPEKVWTTLTDPLALQAWAPFDADRDLGAVGPATLTMVGGAEAPQLRVAVHRADRPQLLEYDWGGDLLRWELEPIPSGTRLTLRHTVGDPAWISKMAAGWHLCLDVADLAMAGTPIGRIVADEARNFGWEELDTAYAEALRAG